MGTARRRAAWRFPSTGTSQKSHGDSIRSGRHACRVMLATDEEAIVDRFVAELGSSVVYCDTHRKVDGDEVFGKGPTGQVVPGYIAKDSSTAVRNGDEAVLEYELPHAK